MENFVDHVHCTYNLLPKVTNNYFTCNREGCPILQQIYAWHCIVLYPPNNTLTILTIQYNREQSNTIECNTMSCINLSEYWTILVIGQHAWADLGPQMEVRMFKHRESFTQCRTFKFRVLISLSCSGFPGSARVGLSPATPLLLVSEL